jgi:predicted TIM-barrel fold metal-dependent hydrolase
VKISDAYFRSLYFEDVSKEKAGEVFDLVLQGQDKEFPMETIKPLSDYMMHRILDLALRYSKPVQIHTGLQAGDGNYIMNSNPALLANLFLKYRDVQFALFHGGYPYGGELASLAKNFRNVYIDLCWLYIISPSYSERYLHEWLETVPASKILGFGGDYENVENIYGHLLFARQIVSKVLTAKVKDGYFTEAEAIRIAGMIMHDNAVNLFRLR